MANFELTSLAATGATQPFSQLLAQSFLADAATEQADIERVGCDNGRLLYHGDQLAGGLLLIPMAQWFGGRAVAMTGVASVAIAPHYRGRGAARTLMEKCLGELHQQKVALSTLYPAAQALYRQVGYEQAGTRCRWQIKPSHLQACKGSLPVQPLPLDAQPLIPLYNRQAKAHNGCLRRAQVIWHRLLQDDSQPVYCYGFGRPDQLEGYLLFTQTTTPQGATLHLRDWAVLTAAAAQSLWSFMATHRSQIDQITWTSSRVDPLGRSLPEQAAVITSSMGWMTRIVHLEQALLHRGYPPVDAELHFNIEDKLLAANNGPFVLTIRSGQPSLKPGGQGDIALSINTLASLYTGLWSAQQLQQMDALSAPESSLAILGTLFSGGSPWMGDFF